MPDKEMYVDEELPDTLEWYKDQIAGHHPSVVKNGMRQIGIVKEHGRNEYLLKLVQDGKKGKSEVNFYEAIFDLNKTLHTKKQKLALQKLQTLVPHYFGIRTINIANREYEFLELEDITYPYKKPCIMDIKIGRVTYDPNAEESKKAKEMIKCPAQMDLGFRILGYRLHPDDQGNVRVRDRDWGRLLTRENIGEAIEEYFQAAPKSKISDIISVLLGKLKIISDWFNEQESIQIYASSLLFVYEGDKNHYISPTVRMIDFSHVFYDDIKDNNYIPGLQSITQQIAAYGLKNTLENSE